jgi:cell wall-associated NlpC family hydrolase
MYRFGPECCCRFKASQLIKSDFQTSIIYAFHFSYFFISIMGKEEMIGMKKITQIGISLTVLASLWSGQVPQVSAASTYATEVIYGVNMRSGPSSSSTVYRMLRKGEDVHVLEKTNDYWLKIEDTRGTIGYISASDKYTNYNPSTSIAVGGVNFRSEAKVANNKIGFIPKGSKVEVIEAVSGLWLKIKYNGLTGFASASYFDYVPPAPSATASEIVSTAVSYIGQFRYQYGAEPWTTNNQYSDCSAFVQLVFNKIHGYNLPRTSIKQSKEGTMVQKSELKPGDLVFFDTNNDGIINHDGIYIGNGEFVHMSPSNDVGINNLTSGYWGDNYITARRVL